MEINKWAFAIALSMMLGIVVLVLTLLSAFVGFKSADSYGFGVKALECFDSFQPKVMEFVPGNGFNGSNIVYILVSFVYAIVDGFIIGFLFATFYNVLLKKIKK